MPELTINAFEKILAIYLLLGNKYNLDCRLGYDKKSHYLNSKSFYWEKILNPLQGERLSPPKAVYRWLKKMQENEVLAKSEPAIRKSRIFMFFGQLWVWAPGNSLPKRVKVMPPDLKTAAFIEFKSPRK